MVWRTVQESRGGRLQVDVSGGDKSTVGVLGAAGSVAGACRQAKLLGVEVRFVLPDRLSIPVLQDAIRVAAGGGQVVWGGDAGVLLRAFGKMCAPYAAGKDLCVPVRLADDKRFADFMYCREFFGAGPAAAGTSIEAGLVAGLAAEWLKNICSEKEDVRGCG